MRSNKHRITFFFQSSSGEPSIQLAKPLADGKTRRLGGSVLGSGLYAGHQRSNSGRDAKIFQIASAMQTGKNAGMQTLSDAIQDLLTKK